jgi:hypothetical protein
MTKLSVGARRLCGAKEDRSDCVWNRNHRIVSRWEFELVVDTICAVRGPPGAFVPMQLRWLRGTGETRECRRTAGSRKVRYGCGTSRGIVLSIWRGKESELVCAWDGNPPALAVRAHLIFNPHPEPAPAQSKRH